MSFTTLIKASNNFEEELFSLISTPRFNNSARFIVSELACSLSFEHWASLRLLLSNNLLPSAAVIHRVQFEFLVRSIWILYAASETQIEKLSIELSLETEQAAKNLPSVARMMQDLSIKAPEEAFAALSRFKVHSWKALNSYVHAGIHPLARHDSGYPHQLIENLFKNSNGLAVVAGMQASVLSEQQGMMKMVLDLAKKYEFCMPPPL